jgi:hypothetical protein
MAGTNARSLPFSPGPFIEATAPPIAESALLRAGGIALCAHRIRNPPRERNHALCTSGQLKEQAFGKHVPPSTAAVLARQRSSSSVAKPISRSHRAGDCRIRNPPPRGNCALSIQNPQSSAPEQSRSVHFRTTEEQAFGKHVPPSTAAVLARQRKSFERQLPYFSVSFSTSATDFSDKALYF